MGLVNPAFTDIHIDGSNYLSKSSIFRIRINHNSPLVGLVVFYGIFSQTTENCKLLVQYQKLEFKKCYSCWTHSPLDQLKKDLFCPSSSSNDFKSAPLILANNFALIKYTNGTKIINKGIK